jgi:hypothetical protein
MKAKSHWILKLRRRIWEKNGIVSFTLSGKENFTNSNSTRQSMASSLLSMHWTSSWEVHVQPCRRRHLVLVWKVIKWIRGYRTSSWLKYIYRVYSVQIDPRRRYHSISRSLREYSVRSRAAEVGTIRRRLRETNSMVSAMTKGRLDCLSVADKVADRKWMKIQYLCLNGYNANKQTIYERSHDVDNLG